MWPTPDELAHDLLTEDGPQGKRVVVKHPALAFTTDSHAPFNVFRCVMRPEGPNDGGGLILGLEQPWHEHLLVRPDASSLSFQPNEVAVLR